MQIETGNLRQGEKGKIPRTVSIIREEFADAYPDLYTVKSDHGKAKTIVRNQWECAPESYEEMLGKPR